MSELQAEFVTPTHSFDEILTKLTVGHTKVRCKEPDTEESAGDNNGGGAQDGESGNTGGDTFDTTPATGEESQAAPAASSGGDKWELPTTSGHGW